MLFLRFEVGRFQYRTPMPKRRRPSSTTEGNLVPLLGSTMTVGGRVSTRVSVAQTGDASLPAFRPLPDAHAPGSRAMEMARPTPAPTAAAAMAWRSAGLCGGFGGWGKEKGKRREPMAVWTQGANAECWMVQMEMQPWRGENPHEVCKQVGISKHCYTRTMDASTLGLGLCCAQLGALCALCALNQMITHILDSNYSFTLHHDELADFSFKHGQ